MNPPRRSRERAARTATSIVLDNEPAELHNAQIDMSTDEATSGREIEAALKSALRAPTIGDRGRSHVVVAR